jgi:hypothetical protein
MYDRGKGSSEATDLKNFCAIQSVPHTPKVALLTMKRL